MAGDEKKIIEAVELLALQTVMVEADDLMAVGAILERLEEIEKIGAAQPPVVLHLSGALKQLVEKIILQELPDPAAGLSLLREGVTLLQAKIHGRPAASPQDEEKFENTIRALVLDKAAPAVPQKEDNPEPGSPAPEAADFSQDREICTNFVSEANEHLESIELNIINLEQSPDDPECLNAIFRSFHTIKGVSGFLNLPLINKFAHAMESLLDEARNHKLTIDQNIIDFILEAVDLLKRMILDLRAHLESGRVEMGSFDLDPYLEKIAIFQNRETRQTTSGEGEESEPAAGQSRLGEILTSQGVISRDELRDALQTQAEDGGRKIGEILIQEKKATSHQVVEALRDQKRQATSAEPTVKVDTQKLDNLIDLVGELVIAQSLVTQNPVFSGVQDQKLTRDFSQLYRITSDLQRISMSLRMIPIRQTFQRMIRLVRDLAKKSGKQVELLMSGEETEIDRNMVDMLYDPLVHMIRNSIDHGIESPERRREIGKPVTGQVWLRAFHKGGYIVIEIEDDGQGLNRPRILEKARAKGLVEEDASLNEYQIDNLIFEPGFSTAEKVTDISGRGVGMDVVKRAIEQLKGRVEIFSATGKGCRFVIRVPLTLAIMDGIVVRIGDDRYIMPTIFIKETLRPNRDDLFSVQDRGELLRVRNTFIPLVRLYRVLGVEADKKDPWEALVVLVENEGKLKGLLVDDLIGKQEVVIKNLGEELKIKGVAGATVMGDGRVGLILDIHGILDIDLET